MTGAAVGAIVAALPISGDHETAEQAVIHLPDEFWNARPVLAHIRQAARARLVAPDAVLGSVLTRIAAISPHTIELPAIVGAPLGLTCLVASVGPPESGKSASSAVAAELVPAPHTIHDRLPIGSGEGLVEILFEMVDVEGDDGKPRREKRQTRHAAIFHIDEGAVLADLGARSGSTLLATIRTAYTHGTLGNTNANVERRRILDGRSYVYGITLGIQPELAGRLLADTNAGTPQRFIWLRATDPTITDDTTPWPGPLNWTPPTPTRLEPHTVDRAGWRRHQLAIPDLIATDIRTDRLTAMRGDQPRQPGDAHRTLVRLKIAALLAILDGRLELDPDDWQLAATVADTSSRVRRNVETTLAFVEHHKEIVATERNTRRQLHVEDTKEARALTSSSRSVGQVVTRHATKKQHQDQGGGCTNRCLARAMASQHRALVPVDDTIAETVRLGWIIERDGRWYPGESRPA